ncbi:uncharacterized protein TNCT_160051 [Trichonephila clavata]|uniref:Uncharacterized protein n=1 Tax=Trichonephila clavata TaxID=2740835 RepID=A0A8X6G3S5_TRICU|nr:uncharacterized protein TNCT_160051 [Trichonephila clavata]
MMLWNEIGKTSSEAGAIFTPGTEEQQSAFKYTIHLHNTNDSQARFKVEPVIEVLDSPDAFKMARARK